MDSNPPCRRILIADDLKDNADSMAMALESMGHDVEAVYDGEQALEVAARWRPEVLFLDLGMPKRDGYEVARQIRAEEWGQTIHLIALTGWGQEEDRRRTQEAGFDHHLVKPVDLRAIETLLDTINLRGGSASSE